MTRTTIVDQRPIDRAMIAAIERGLREDGCALLIGPYEVGKSALARKVADRFGEGAHLLNGSDEADRERMPNLVRNSAGKLIVLDEVQGFPAGLRTGAISSSDSMTFGPGA